MFFVVEIDVPAEVEEFDTLETAEVAALERSANDHFIGVYDEMKVLVSIAYKWNLFSS